MTYHAPAMPMYRLRSRAMLEAAMQARDVNGNELARLSGVSGQTVSNLRRGRCVRTHKPIAVELCNVLGVDPADLFDDADPFALGDDDEAAAS